MNLQKYTIVLGLLMCFGCSTNAANDSKFLREDVDRPIQGTDTAVVKIGLKEDGMPFVENEKVVVKVGQRVVLVGPAGYKIRFPKGSPFEADSFGTEDAVINLVIPRELEKRMKKEKKEYLVYKYDVIVGNKILDPLMVIMPH